MEATTFNREQKILLDLAVDTAIEKYTDPNTFAGEGFLGLGDCWGPLAEHWLIDHGYKTGERFTVRHAAKWEFTAARVRASHSFDDFTPSSYCRETYDICLEKLSVDERSYLKFVHTALEQALIALSNTARHAQPFFRARFELASCHDAWQCCGFSKARPGHAFSADLMRYGILDVDRDAVAVPFAICAGRETLHGKKVPMVRVSEDLEVDILKMLPSHGTLVAFDCFDVCRSISGIWMEVIVTGVRCYDIAVEAAAEADRKQMAQAMKVVESLTTPCKKKPRRCKEHSTMKRRLTHRAAELASVDLKHVFDLASSDSSEEEVMEEGVEE